ncbi:Hemin import ATP-binding protein HmuV [BD1-7 clade bacterium]|uniref:Hemin import ATP-binding protein HmuV n=1 Tax=BD1-7 clade bacterium TaxID=2029982 RepID=A0A5S9N3I2_9GAMM|nr:Hemin import ATP-binding protein HmuV [BD1-7 clade bacterium]
MDNSIHLQTHQLCWQPPGTPARILDDVHLTVKQSHFVGVLGPNGSGKTSLLRCLYRSEKPDQGSITLDGQSLLSYSSQDLAKKLAVVLQEHPADIPLCVDELLRLGRIPHRDFLSRDRRGYSDYEQQINTELDISRLLKRSYENLSGGEKQRVMIARALYQKPELLILDEPTNHLDIAHQLSIMRYLAGLKITVICSLHDLNLAAHFCDEVAIMHQGRLVEQGTPEAVFTPETIKQVFNVNAISDQHPSTGSLRLSFY